MKPKTRKGIFDHSGSSFGSFLDKEGIREEVESIVVKRVLAWLSLRPCSHFLPGMGREAASKLDTLLIKTAAEAPDTVAKL